MTITINGTPIVLDWDTILVWALIGLVAGFVASHVALGHGVGLLGDILAGLVGAFVGGFLLSDVFHVSIGIVGHPIISEMVVAFIGAVVLLFIVRLLGGGRSRHKANA
jgi:uncharacterized membrane protein YeaQ/YmgE (transglycosylase-associated protein family)